MFSKSYPIAPENKFEKKLINLTNLSNKINVDKILQDLTKLDLKKTTNKELTGNICEALASLNPNLTLPQINQIIDFAFAISDWCSPTTCEIFCKLDGIIPSNRLQEIMVRLTKYSRDLGWSSIRSDAYEALEKMPLTSKLTNQIFKELMRCASPTDPFPKPLIRSAAWNALVELYPAFSETQKDQVIDAMLTTEYYHLISSIKTAMSPDKILRIMPTLFDLCKKNSFNETDVGVLTSFREYLSKEQLAEMHQVFSMQFPGIPGSYLHNTIKYIAVHANTIELKYCVQMMTNAINLPQDWTSPGRCEALAGFAKIMPAAQTLLIIDHIILTLKNQRSASPLESLTNLLLELKKLGKTTAEQNKCIFDFLHSHLDSSDYSIVGIAASTLLALDINITPELRKIILRKLPCDKKAFSELSLETIKRFKPYVSSTTLNLMIEALGEQYRWGTNQFAEFNLLRPPSLPIALQDCNKILAAHRLSMRYETGAITFQTAVKQILAILNYFSDEDKVTLFNNIVFSCEKLEGGQHIKTYNVLNRVYSTLNPQLGAKVAKSVLYEEHFFPSPLTDIVADYVDNMPTRLSR